MTGNISTLDRPDYLVEVLTALYPPPYSLSVSRTPAGGHRPGTQTELAVEYRLAPHRRRPRLAVPAEPRMAAAALRAGLRGGSTAVRLGLRGMFAKLAVRLFRERVQVYGPANGDCFGSYLAEALGVDVPHFVLHLGGPARANRKPVTGLLDASGTTVGYAKLGVSPLTRALVRNERAALRTLANAALQYTRIPALLHAGVWRGHEVIVQSALPTWRPATRGGELVARSMHEVARSCGTHRGRLADAAYWSRLRARIAELPDHRLRVAVERLTHAAGDLELEYGAWHGDWSPWNTQRLGESVLVWDWERFAVGVPMGFDALHHGITARLDDPNAARTALDGAVKLLAPFDVPARQARVTAALYLLDIASRYIGDGQRTVAARTVIDHLLPTLLDRKDAE